MHIYTDGAYKRIKRYSKDSPKSHAGSWGYVFVISNTPKYENYSKEILFKTTSQKMELLAVLKALLEYSSMHYSITHPNVTIFTDSSYIEKSFNEWMEGWKRAGWLKSDLQPVENIELIQLLYMYKLSIPGLQIKHVKGHSGIKYNERADELANIAFKLYDKKYKEQDKLCEDIMQDTNNMMDKLTLDDLERDSWISIRNSFDT